ncbi:MAG: HAMP domain-containing protein [Gemmatimonadota bacterium]|nr:MAG: HAMP domain-containing protein [Gemmatimonadota bacterium]
MSSSLSFKLFLVLFLSIVILSAIDSAIRDHLRRQMMEEQVKSDAYRASDFIKRSLLGCMMRNEREHIYETIALLGSEPGIEVIRIYNKHGEIKFSSVASEIGTALDMQAEACYACHESDQPLQFLPTAERARIYTKEHDYRVLGLINPIRTNESCSSAACHVHAPDQSILGVLDVQMSMQSMDEGLAAARRQRYAVTTLILFLAALLMAGIVYYAVYSPTKKLRGGTEALAKGKLDVQIDLKRSDELGALADSFNRMARNLRAADEELRAWSHMLEDRIQEKTKTLEQVHQQMMQSEKAASLGKMAATVAHELNNPLSGILTCAKLAAKKVGRIVPDGGEKQDILDNLELIRSESARCGNIVRDLLTYARESSTEFEEAHLHELVARALKLVSHHTELGGVDTEAHLLLEDDALICDGEQILQALIALMINAIEAMPNGGRLKVKTWDTPDGPLDRVCLSVSDTGVGIPEDALARVFDPFFSTKDETKGVGLGLSVVHGIVQRHGGEVSVSSSPGEGTTFTIQVPRDPKRAMSERVQASKLT